MKLFIAGFPGTGKTFLGDNIESTYRYTHINMETPEGIKLVNSTRRSVNKTVVTWGYIPDRTSYGLIDELQRNGYSFVWLESTDYSSYEIYTNREMSAIAAGLRQKHQTLGHQLYILGTQSESIRKDTINRSRYSFHTINPFSSYCGFKDSVVICNEIERAVGQKF